MKTNNLSINIENALDFNHLLIKIASPTIMSKNHLIINKSYRKDIKSSDLVNKIKAPK
jgi:hypothetical protein